MVNRRPLSTVPGLLALALSVSVPAQAGDDPAEVLKRATEKVIANSKTLSNHTCVETVTRDFFGPAVPTPPRACSAFLAQSLHPATASALQHLVTDRFRLDVTLVVGGEIFSWVGASRFDDQGLEHLVNSGPIGTGAFDAFLDVVFRFDAQGIRFQKYVLAEGPSLLEYSIEVPKSDSHYLVRLGESWVPIGYSGTFQLNSETGEVVRMTIQTAELPALTGQCTAITNLDFGMTTIGGSQFMMPARASQRFVARDNHEVTNDIAIADCREYRGESTISFPGEPQLPMNRAETPVKNSLPLPDDLHFTLELTTPIRSDTAAAGDSFAGRLTRPLRDAKHKVLAPAGSVVEGRLLRVECFHTPPLEVIMVLKLRTLEVNGAKVPLAAVRDWKLALAAGGNRRKGWRVALPLQGEQPAAAFEFAGEHVVLKRGMRSDWRTVSSGEVGKER